jgi:hypothetical protein
MPVLSWTFASGTSIASGMPYFSTPKWTLTPQIFLPPSMPRPKQLGAERQDLSPDSRLLADSERGLSMTTAVGSAVSPQASRHVRRRRSSSQRHSPSRGQRDFD